MSVILIFKFVIKPAYENFLANKVEIAQIEKQSSLNREEMRVQNELDSNSRLHTSHLEFEVYKKDRVLPHLENINKILIEHNMHYNNYGQYIVNKTMLRKEFETKRLKLDSEFIENKDKIAIYIPSEFRLLLNRIRVIISVSWKDPIILNGNLAHFDTPIKFIDKSLEIYRKYVECFYEMVAEYIKITDETKDYAKILSNHGFNEKAEYISKKLTDRVAMAYILLHEYMDTEEFKSIDQEFEKTPN
ncbi:hypothetical protein DV702_08890 [Sporosarcina sp. PTS2304]|uniref:hypothetical protein n=1 Tax=Sporosarcina sp. PTS2304 TaxID=2283194 RepID=UPI000E0DB290|nr:hypothetical protein [Sporosarcina sp. PTS2304]AXH99840.1 hypothetical protein DV702_08890 [Sporosarcina sp. PTS2304]